VRQKKHGTQLNPRAFKFSPYLQQVGAGEHFEVAIAAPLLRT
jgi:hypothetical protein